MTTDTTANRMEMKSERERIGKMVGECDERFIYKMGWMVATLQDNGWQI